MSNLTTSFLTALQLDAAAGLLQNQGLAINANLLAAISSYTSTPLMQPYFSTIATGSTGNILSAGTINSLQTLAANTCPALSDSLPTAYSSLGTQMITVIENEAAVDFCGGNTSKLTQAVNQAAAYSDQSSICINSAVNSQT